jgi:hypothetical protein
VGYFEFFFRNFWEPPPSAANRLPRRLMRSVMRAVRNMTFRRIAGFATAFLIVLDLVGCAITGTYAKRASMIRLRKLSRLLKYQQ